MKKILCILLFSISSFPGFAQDTIVTEKKLMVSGYVKNLQTLTFDSHFREMISGNIIHNRVNMKWKPTSTFTGVAEFRTRVFWGDELRMNPQFATMLRNQNEKLDLQKAWINKKFLVAHTNTERLYIDQQLSDLNIRVGRQRINWGVTTTWNPNDIFNTYNFLDFDYEERPGVDGADMKYVFSNAFKAELAYAHTGKKNGSVAALKYSLNKWNYDFQLITGWYNDHITVGAGWDGYIGNAGFKGEVQYLPGNKDSSDHLNIALETEYMFSKGWFAIAGFLYNKNGFSRPMDTWNPQSLNLSPENLMPTRWNAIVNVSKAFTPLFSGTMSVVYAPGTNLVILFPSLQYNLATNLDVNLVWQSFFAESAGRVEPVTHICFLRAKWNF